MTLSKHNIFSRIADSDNYFIVNLLNGSADILAPDEAAMLLDFQKGKELPADFRESLTAQGYIVNPEEEARLYQSTYLDFLDARDDDELQIFFVPNYACNFACTYCYQDEYTNNHQHLSIEIIDAFFRYITTEFASRKKYLTIFGGEPLRNSAKQKEIITYLLQQARAANLDVALVTNGFALVDYMDILKDAPIREIQVTLDGTSYMHNKRRFLKDGSPTFNNIVEGIDACLANHLPINLRMVVDKENIAELPALAAFAIEKGWTKSDIFKTQLGRNYELHHCQADAQNLFSRISLYENIYHLVKEFPHILEFHKPAYSISKFLFENGDLPHPLFDSCPACKTEWAFDYTGTIYSCTATVGKADEALGTFYPEISRKQDLISAWENRDVTTIPECADCNVQLACGGGCGSIAKNKNNTICSADCRHVTNLLKLGFASYFP